MNSKAAIRIYAGIAVALMVLAGIVGGFIISEVLHKRQPIDQIWHIYFSGSKQLQPWDGFTTRSRVFLVLPLNSGAKVTWAVTAQPGLGNATFVYGQTGSDPIDSHGKVLSGQIVTVYPGEWRFAIVYLPEPLTLDPPTLSVHYRFDVWN